MAYLFIGVPIPLASSFFSDWEYYYPRLLQSVQIYFQHEVKAIYYPVCVFHLNLCNIVLLKLYVIFINIKVCLHLSIYSSRKFVSLFLISLPHALMWHFILIWSCDSLFPQVPWISLTVLSSNLFLQPYPECVLH